MKIRPVSFQGRINNTNSKKINNNQNINNQDNSSEQKNKKRPICIASVLAGSALSLLLTQSALAPCTKPKSNVIIPFDSNKTTVEQVARTYNIDEEAINSYNNISDAALIGKMSEIKIPAKFDYLQTAIDKTVEKLYSQEISDEERADAEKTMDAMLKKQAEQRQVATAYSDGNFVYIHINIKDDAPEDIKDRYQFGINIESLKKLFDIKDGGIENNNNIDFRYDMYGRTGDNEYKDYTQNWFHNGDTVKVPISDFNQDDINLNPYLD